MKYDDDDDHDDGAAAGKWKSDYHGQIQAERTERWITMGYQVIQIQDTITAGRELFYTHKDYITCTIVRLVLSWSL